MVEPFSFDLIFMGNRKVSGLKCIFLVVSTAFST